MRRFDSQLLEAKPLPTLSNKIRSLSPIHVTNYRALAFLIISQNGKLAARRIRDELTKLLDGGE